MGGGYGKERRRKTSVDQRTFIGEMGSARTERGTAVVKGGSRVRGGVARVGQPVCRVVRDVTDDLWRS